MPDADVLTFIRDHNALLRHLRGIVARTGRDLTEVALVLLDRKMALCTEHLIPEIERVCITEGSDELAWGFAVDREALAPLLRLRDVPIAGSAVAFVAVADELANAPEGPHPWIVSIAEGGIVLFDPHAALPAGSGLRWGATRGAA